MRFVLSYHHHFQRHEFTACFAEQEVTTEFEGMLMKVTDTAGLDDGLDMQVQIFMFQERWKF
jgi:hypothetical protein